MPTIRDVKDKLKEIVTEKQGIKAPDVIPWIPLDLLFFDIPSIIAEMVRDGELVEVEYVLPLVNYKAKSFLLPAGTEVAILEAKRDTATAELPLGEPCDEKLQPA